MKVKEIYKKMNKKRNEYYFDSAEYKNFKQLKEEGSKTLRYLQRRKES